MIAKPEQLVAVIDLGKTNKKVSLIDAHLRQVASASANFPAQISADGVLCEDIDGIWKWLQCQLAELYRAQPFHALSVTTHGATWAALDANGELALPVIAYEHALTDAEQAALDTEFYLRCGPLETLQDETGTCDLPLLINPAKAVLFAQHHYADAWPRVTNLVNYPQFWGQRLTGVIAHEPTYTANHSFLFAIRTGTASRAAKALNVERLLGLDLKDPWARLGTLTPMLQKRLDLPALPVAVGIHDSNAALLPYLVKHATRDFVLNSTGTWCVAMHRVAHIAYRPEELGQKVIFNRDAFGRAQKVSFLMGGQDYGLYHGLIGGADPAFDGARVDAALLATRDAVLPGAFPSQFPRCRGGLLADDQVITLDALKAGTAPVWFRDAARAHDLLNISLALQTEVALRRTDITDRTAIFVEGGFRNNPVFLAVLAALFPNNDVVLTNLAQATSAGAALLGHALLSDSTPAALADGIVIDEQPVARPSLPNLAVYRTAWLAAVS